MTQEEFKKAQELQEQLDIVTREIEDSCLPEGFMYHRGVIVYYIKNGDSGDSVKYTLSIPKEIIETVIHEVRELYIKKQSELTKQFEEL